MGYIAIIFLFSSINTFIKEIDPKINSILPIVDQTRATPAIANFNKKNVIPIYLRI